MTGMKMSLVTIATVAVLTALVLPTWAPGATAVMVPASSGGSPMQWAYGGQRWSNTTVNFANGTFTSRAFFGEQVVITETNTSATTRQIEGVRTIAESYFAQYCQPDCTHAVGSANLSHRAWQQVTAFVNLTTNGTVYEYSNGSGVTGVAALGILNASSRVRGELNDSYAIARGTNSGSHGSLDVNRSGAMSVTFSPSLGIVPWNVSAGERWNSTSAFQATGGWNDTFSYSNDLHGITSSASSSSGGTVNRAGNESLRGADLGPLTLRNGVNATVVVLGYFGPFTFGDGIFLTTAQADLFGGMGAGWTPRAFATGQVATVNLDLVVDHRVGMAVTAAASVSASVGSTALGATTVQAGPPSPQPPPPNSNEAVQAQPESPQSAEQASQCLVGGCTTSASPHLPIGSGGILLVAVVAIAVLVGALVVLARRPRRPSPTASVSYSGGSDGGLP